MAFVLSLPPQSPLKRSFSETPYLRPGSPLSDDASGGTVRQYASCNVSATSLASTTSFLTVTGYIADENTFPSPAAHSLRYLANELRAAPTCRRVSSHIPRKSSWGTDIPPPPRPRSQGASYPELEARPLQNFDLDNDLVHLPTLGDNYEYEALHVYDVPLDGFPEESTLSVSSVDIDRELASVEEGETGTPAGNSHTLPFRRWLSTLRRRNLQKKKGLVTRAERWPLDSQDTEPLNHNQHESTLARQSGHRKSLSQGSSLAFVTKVKSATITLASSSIAPLSRIGTRVDRLRRENRSSSFSDARGSMDSARSYLEPIIDEGVWHRSVQRRKTLEEIIASEEGYIGDMKALIDVSFTLLSSASTLSLQTRTSIHQNLSEIVQLHEDILGELHKVVPNSEYTMGSTMQLPEIPRPKHIRWHSADIVTSRQPAQKLSRKPRLSLDLGRHTEERPAGVSAGAKTAADVARVFNKFLKRFSAYEEYGSQYERMRQDASSSSKDVPAWHAYERGMEALTNSLAPVNGRGCSGKKSLTYLDLLMKPIQRVTKYHLLFERLCKDTPVCDDPESHAELEKVWLRLKETATRVNNAQDDPKIRKLVETTWLLQDRLVFEESQALSWPAVARLLGHVILCGVLHVGYQANDRVRGQFMICVLYRSCLVLATATKSFNAYDVVAAIALANGSVEEADNGRGLQCHTAPYTWKFVFEHGNRIFELIMSACSAKEEEEWRKHINARITAENDDLAQGRSDVRDLFASLTLDLRSIGHAFGLRENHGRRLSIHRAATLGPKTNLHQVIIKNTEAQNALRGNQSATSLPVARSQSLLSAGHIPTLAPRRGERTRLENALADVWTKDVLPYPGMGSRRPENPIRASANSVMRKLSMASITSNFSKRSASYASLANSRREDPYRLGQRLSNPALSKKSCPRTTKPLVDFHNTPRAFLPADFELEIAPAKTKANRATLSVVASQPSSASENLADLVQPPKTAENRALRVDSLRATESSDSSSTNLTVITSTTKPEPYITSLDGTVTDMVKDTQPSQSAPTASTSLKGSKTANPFITPAKRSLKPRRRLLSFLGLKRSPIEDRPVSAG